MKISKFLIIVMVFQHTSGVIFLGVLVSDFIEPAEHAEHAEHAAHAEHAEHAEPQLDLETNCQESAKDLAEELRKQGHNASVVWGWIPHAWVNCSSCGLFGRWYDGRDGRILSKKYALLDMEWKARGCVEE